MKPLDELRRLVERAPVGPVVDGGISTVLREVWESLTGDDEAMRAYKLERIENLSRTEDGRLEFEVERHGGTVQGSKYGEIQGWWVDPAAGTKTAYTAGRRRLEPRQPRLDVRTLAEGIHADLGANDPKWTKRTDKGWRVHVGRIIPDEGPKQTVRGRRKRLRAALAPCWRRGASRSVTGGSSRRRTEAP